MRLRNLFLAIFPVALLLSSNMWATPKYKVLHAFGAGQDGGGLWGSLAFDRKGNLYGTTSGGGPYAYGTVFQLTPKSGGKWAEKLLHSFREGDRDGEAPFSNVVVDALGYVYGTTALAGPNGHGTAFELRFEQGKWVLSLLYGFCAKPQCKDGGSPYAGLVMDERGNLYGTAGAAFELSHVSGRWNEKVLYQFCSKPNCRDGNAPLPV
jgi:uncharacterized repeat protein (TIGR03803 family)